VHCYAESSPERAESLELPALRALLDDAKSLRFEVVQLTGGDPLISPHCIAAAEYADRIGIPNLEVYTNGLALRGEVYERLRRLGVSFAFSLYSHDAARHDAITRTPGSHHRTTRAIRRAVEDGLSVRTGTVIMEQNEGDADATRDYLTRLGVDPSAIGVGQSRAVGRGDLHDLRKRKSDTAQPRGGSIERHGDPDANARPFGGTAAVSYDGRVYPCIFSRHLALGSIRDQSLRAILNAPEPVVAPTENLLTERAHWAKQLACWECQTRSSMLGAAIDA
jgi:MoaA/NifB/PqqE/SkfB family radical SAM enzyme